MPVTLKTEPRLQEVLLIWSYASAIAMSDEGVHYLEKVHRTRWWTQTPDKRYGSQAFCLVESISEDSRQTSATSWSGCLPPREKRGDYSLYRIRSPVMHEAGISRINLPRHSVNAISLQSPEERKDCCVLSVCPRSRRTRECYDNQSAKPVSDSFWYAHTHANC